MTEAQKAWEAHRLNPPAPGAYPGWAHALTEVQAPREGIEAAAPRGEDGRAAAVLLLAEGSKGTKALTAHVKAAELTHVVVVALQWTEEVRQQLIWLRFD